jgi:hypothetical protein
LSTTDPLRLTPTAERQLKLLARALIGIAEEQVLARHDQLKQQNEARNNQSRFE